MDTVQLVYITLAFCKVSVGERGKGRGREEGEGEGEGEGERVTFLS